MPLVEVLNQPLTARAIDILPPPTLLPRRYYLKRNANVYYSNNDGEDLLYIDN
jgi:hypothetical protein